MCIYKCIYTPIYLYRYIWYPLSVVVSGSGHPLTTSGADRVVGLADDGFIRVDDIEHLTAEPSLGEAGKALALAFERCDRGERVVRADVAGGGRGPGADSTGVSPVPVRMWAGLEDTENCGRIRYQNQPGNQKRAPPCSTAYKCAREENDDRKVHATDK
jgi:hypothetical protein